MKSFLVGFVTTTLVLLIADEAFDYFLEKRSKTESGIFGFGNNVYRIELLFKDGVPVNDTQI